MNYFGADFKLGSHGLAGGSEYKVRVDRLDFFSGIGTGQTKSEYGSGHWHGHDKSFQPAPFGSGLFFDSNGRAVGGHSGW